MKKLILSLLLTKSLFAFDFNSLFSNTINSLLGESPVTKAAQMCYEPNISTPNLGGMCDALNFQISESLDICQKMPNIPFLNKKSQTETIGFGTESLQDYCKKTINQKLESVTSNAEIWSVENELEDSITYPNGYTKEDFYRGDEPILDLTDLDNKKNESITAMYLSSKEKFHQQTAKYLIDLAKVKKVTKVTEIKPSDIKVAEDMIAYEQQVNELSSSISSDILVSSSNTISSVLSSQLTSYTDEQNQDNANNTASQYASDLKEIVEKTSRTKKGIYKQLLAESSDLAVPTQQTLNLYKDAVKPKYAMIIRKQQARESYINSIIDTEVKIRQDIIDLSAKKAVIMKSSFDESSAMNEIDNYVN